MADISSLNEILVFARKEKATDVHLSPASPIVFRQLGKLKHVTTTPVSAQQIKDILNAALPQEVMKQFDASGDGEFVHTIQGQGRFRISLMKQREGWELTARLIPLEIPKFETTGMPASCANLTKWAQGLVLVTGPAGAGKTTTLAVLVDMINAARHDHIITIEQPIEIVFKPQQCQITQREIGAHTNNQVSALRAALREDPDILVISELRDLKSMQLAISAAETGHLVFGTMNTVNAAQTISRIIDSFPGDDQPVIRNMISESLRGVISQQLVPRKDGSGMVPVYEVMIVNTSIANLIRENKISQINNAIMTGKAAGMVLLDNSLETLMLNGTITVEEVRDRATNPALIAGLGAAMGAGAVK